MIATRLGVVQAPGRASRTSPLGRRRAPSGEGLSNYLKIPSGKSKSRRVGTGKGSESLP